jgi:hypothetical protein
VLTTLCLTWNDCGPEGAKAFAAAMQHNTSLTTLNLSPVESECVAKRIEDRIHYNERCALWISQDGGLQRACIVSIFKQWGGMTAEEKTVFKNNASQLPYLIRSRAAKETERITQIGLFKDERWNSPQQIGVDSGLGVAATESAGFFG